jgi:2-amino-4-hydroxy-6-hydroxymethyldihydropteridine diphosphokinase
MNNTYLLLGSNMGNSLALLTTAVEKIEKEIGTVTLQSGLYLTAAWGNHSQPAFLNQVIVVSTTLDASETLQTILAIEKKMGRIRTVKNAPRVIDIDILFFNREIIARPELTVPHPEIQNRRFVLTPLHEIAPLMIHPSLDKTIEELLLQCPDMLEVKKN